MDRTAEQTKDAEHAHTRGWKYVDIEAMEIPDEVIALLPASEARRYDAIPVAIRDRQVAVAVANPGSVEITSALRPLFSGNTMRLVYANPGAIHRKIEEIYSAGSEAARVATAGDNHVTQMEPFTGGDMGRLKGVDETGTVKLFNLIVEDALRKKASDIHIEPTENTLNVRFRVDGKLQMVAKHSSEYGQGIAGLIKVESQMRADNFRTPDSGVLIYKGAGRPIDIRVETAPTAWGQSIVMRLQSEIWRDLTTLGFSKHNEDRFRHILAQPYGIILATGPTGSGKSTTLYSSVREKIDIDTKIITLENPVEYKIPEGVTQISVNEESGMTFAKGLRSILRQDPDVVLVGEIRDPETAETAVDGAMTGHLVFSTLHTNDAAGVLPRMQRLGIDPFLLSSSVLGVVGQRLVRRLCAECKVAFTPTKVILAEHGFGKEKVPNHEMFTVNPDGCNNCQGGFSGRVPIHEVLVVNDELQVLIADDAGVFAITAAAIRGGMTTMRMDGFEKAVEGMTSLGEVNANTRRGLEEDEDDLEHDGTVIGALRPQDPLDPNIPVEHAEAGPDPYKSMHAPATLGQHAQALPVLTELDKQLASDVRNADTGSLLGFTSDLASVGYDKP